MCGESMLPAPWASQSALVAADWQSKTVPEDAKTGLVHEHVEYRVKVADVSSQETARLSVKLEDGLPALFEQVNFLGHAPAPVLQRQNVDSLDGRVDARL